MSKIPAFGLGTFRLQGQTVIDSVRNGLEVGYRAIDTAQIYGNEAEVGEAIAASACAATTCSSRPRSGSTTMHRTSSCRASRTACASCAPTTST